MNSIADVYFCNNKRLMNDFTEKPTRIGRSTVNGMLLGPKTVWIKLALEKRSEEIILNLQDVFYLSNRSSNLINLNLLINAAILFDNKCHNLHNKASRKPLAFAQQ